MLCFSSSFRQHLTCSCTISHHIFSYSRVQNMYLISFTEQLGPPWGQGSPGRPLRCAVSSTVQRRLVHFHLDFLPHSFPGENYINYFVLLYYFVKGVIWLCTVLLRTVFLYLEGRNPTDQLQDASYEPLWCGAGGGRFSCCCQRAPSHPSCPHSSAGLSKVLSVISLWSHPPHQEVEQAA